MNQAIIVKNFAKYQGKYKLFPEINFSDFVTDRNGEKYYYYGSVEKNDKVWVQLLSKEALSRDGSMAGRSKSWWRSLSSENHQHVFVRENPDRVSGADKKCSMFQIKQDGKNLGSAKPCILIREAGDWKVQSANP